ncbi:MAG: hypothetical protein R2852_03700 [Bacteroidia bacterium]
MQDQNQIRKFFQFKRGIINYNFIKVGSTYYDLQTNASMVERIHLHDDGKISLAWTTSTIAAYQRGTGYNHYDLSNWLTVMTQHKT